MRSSGDGQRASHSHDIIVLGASAGGVETLKALVAGLPAELPAAVFVVLHLPGESSSALPSILARAGALAAEPVKSGESIQHGRIYCAPSDSHLIIRRGSILLGRGPKENGFRPAVDVLFRSAALAYHARVVGVVLTGTRDDGTAGLAAIKLCGGIAVVQEPEDAIFPDMPLNALRYVEADHHVSLIRMAPLLTRLAQEPVDPERTCPPQEVGEMDLETRIAALDPDAMKPTQQGSPSGFVCPECQGSLWELREGKLLRFRCRVGHGYSPESVLAEQAQTLQEMLWMIFRALKEKAALEDRLAREAREQHEHEITKELSRRSEDTERQAGIIYKMLAKKPAPGHSHRSARVSRTQTAVSAA